MKAIDKLTTLTEVEKELLVLCERKRACDDKLGACSDHEGQKDGPTYGQFSMPAQAYSKTLDYYIGQHECAIRVLRRLIKLRYMKEYLNARKSPPSAGETKEEA